MGKSQPFLLILKFAIIALNILSGHAFADTAKNISGKDRLATWMATSALRLEYPKKPFRDIAASVLNEHGKMRVMQVSTSTHVCIIKLESDDDTQRKGWIVREKMCWEK
ncbi:hypothetical protein LP420_34215 [Massilia sp. B-10]|nr:hypothetical protein LP420_34215 [Massilia sp. B-10]UUZ53618.1 hypothetical protein LP419_33680 [Massilia sp. H-1]